MTTDQDPQSDSARLARMRRECSPVHPDVVAARRADDERQQAEARRTALGNAQSALQTAIGHLQAVLREKSVPEDLCPASNAARDWLTSIGSEPD